MTKNHNGRDKLLRINETIKNLKDSLAMLEQQAGVDKVELMGVTLIKKQISRIDDLSTVEESQ